jgi:hypothetical protein
MKLRKLIILMLFTALAVVSVNALADEEDLPPFLVMENPQVDEVVEDPVSPDSDGTLLLEDDEALLDFVFPETIQGEPVQAIGAGAFQGCALFRTVTIPACVTEIGEDAFADCPNLQTIILADRTDAEDMILGENWSGGADVLFGLVCQPIFDVSPVIPETPDQEPAEPGDVEDGNLEQGDPEEAEPEDAEPGDMDLEVPESGNGETDDDALGGGEQGEDEPSVPEDDLGDIAPEDAEPGDVEVENTNMEDSSEDS